MGAGAGLIFAAQEAQKQLPPRSIATLFAGARVARVGDGSAVVRVAAHPVPARNHGAVGSRALLVGPRARAVRLEGIVHVRPLLAGWAVARVGVVDPIHRPLEV